MRDTGEAGATYLQEAGYAGGDAMFRAFRGFLSRNGMPEPESLETDKFQTAASSFFRETGWGTITVTALHDVVAMVDTEDWAEADPLTPAQYPACHYTTGLFADFFGRTAGAPLAVLEIECRSSGSPHCRFLLGSAEVMGHVYERMAGGMSYNEAATELL